MLYYYFVCVVLIVPVVAQTVQQGSAGSGQSKPLIDKLSFPFIPSNSIQSKSGGSFGKPLIDKLSFPAIPSNTIQSNPGGSFGKPLIDKLSFPAATSNSIPSNTGGSFGKPLIDKLHFPAPQSNSIQSNQGGRINKADLGKPLVNNLNYPIELANSMQSSPAVVTALRFMAEGNFELEQDDNATPHNPHDDRFVMISARGETVNLIYEEIITIRDVNHRLNSVFDTTPGTVTPAITTIIHGGNAAQSQSSAYTKTSISRNFNINQAGASAGGVKIGAVYSTNKQQQGLSLNQGSGMNYANSGVIPINPALRFGAFGMSLNIFGLRQRLLRNRFLRMALLRRSSVPFVNPLFFRRRFFPF